MYKDFDKSEQLVTIKGRHVTISMVNPLNCYFVAHYKDGSIITGKDLFDTGWKELPGGIKSLKYVLSTGKVIEIPNKFKEYLHLVDASQSMFGDRMFHNVFIKGVTSKGDIISYQIVLRESEASDYKIGDVLVSKDESKLDSKYWKSSVG